MNLPKNYRLISLDSVDSTNEEAKRMIRSGVITFENFVITAKSQTKGKGRLGRSWISEPGNLFVSVVLDGGNASLRHIANDTRLPLMPFLTALAVGDTIRDLTGLSPMYKWPNDILVEGKKISGALIELIEDYIIIGVGINIGSYPKENTNLPAICLNDFTKDKSDVSKVLEKLIKNLDSRLHSEGNIIEEWTSYAYGIGQNITVNQENKQISGVFEGVDATGALILVTNQGKREAVWHGDVRF